MKIARLSPKKVSAPVSISIPGSKSYTNRALILAALTPGTVTLKNPLYSDDTEAMISCLRELGISLSTAPNQITVTGDVSHIEDRQYTLNARDSGTTIRFLLALSCVIPGVQTITGSPRLCERPLKELVRTLQKAGADIQLSTSGRAPVTVSSYSLATNTMTIPGSVSSQFITALLLISGKTEGLVLTLEDTPISVPYIDMTIDILWKWGIRASRTDEQTVSVEPGQQYKATEYVIEGDYSAAGYFIGLSSLTGVEVVMENLAPDSLQADRQLLEAMKELGGTVQADTTSVCLKAPPVPPIDIDMEDYPDQVQTMAVLCAFANGKSIIRGVQSLRVKETERVFAVQSELQSLGIQTHSTHDTLTIHGGTPRPARIRTYGDHRMAMSFAVAGSRLKPMEIENPDVVNKTFPDFWNQLRKIIDVEIS